MRLLFIKLKHIGDSLLLTPTVAAARQACPGAEIWVVVRKGCEGILAGCPAIDRVLTSAAPESKNRGLSTFTNELRLIRELRSQKFDYAFELTDGDRGRALALLSGAENRCTNVAGWPMPWIFRWRFNRTSKYGWQTKHRVEKDFYTVNDCLPIGVEPGPLIFDESRTQGSPIEDKVSDFAVIHAGTRWRRKRWSEEKWQQIARHLLTRVPRIVVSAGPDAEEIKLANFISNVAPERIVSTDGKLNWAQLAGLLHKAKLFVGVDTAAMHLAAACGAPIVALFGPSIESEWKPWKANAIVVSPPLSREPNDFFDRTALESQRSINDISVEQVTAACDRLLA